MGILDKVQFYPSTTVNTELGTTTILSSIIDSEGAEGVLFCHQMSTGSSGGGHYRLLGSTGNSTAAMVHIGHSAGSTVATTGYVIDVSSALMTAATWNARFVAIDVVKPSKRYVMAAIDGTTTIHKWFQLKYGLRRQGSTEAKDSTTIGGTTSIIGGCSS